LRPLRDLILYCDRPSNTVNELARRLNSRRIYGDPSRRLRDTRGGLIINYGTGHHPNWNRGDKSILVNSPEAIQQAISKVTSYERFKEAGVPTVEFTTDHDVARGWAVEGINVLSRRDGLSSGSGITFSKDDGNVRKSDFYVKYFPKTHEYRVHVFRDRSNQSSGRGEAVDSYRVIDITQKKRSTGVVSEGDGRSVYQRVVRSLDNGWVHAHGELHLPAETLVAISKAAVDACAALGLDFCAVDVLARYSKKDPNKLLELAVCECNTAPGLANEVTINAYINAIERLYEITSNDRRVPVRRRVRKLVPVTFVSRKGNRITRMRWRRVWETSTL
jgi:hypothetical protein